MTPLKPIENRRVRAVASERYTLNKYCASPMSEPVTLAQDAHHCFARSLIGGDSWFVEIEEDGGQLTLPMPHVVGLSREQHERVERHDAWIKLEDGVWNWYERNTIGGVGLDQWVLVGPLDPQPGYTSTSKSRKRKQGEARRKRRTISIRVPADSENGGEIWDEMIEAMNAKLVREGRYAEEDHIPPFEGIHSAVWDWINS